MDILYINQPTQTIRRLRKGPTTLYHAELITPANGKLSLYDGGNLIFQWDAHPSRVGCYMDFWALPINKELGYTFEGGIMPPEKLPTPSWMWGITVAIASNSGGGVHVQWFDAMTMQEGE